MHILDKQFGLFLSSNQIQARIRELAMQIESEYNDKDPLFVVVLNGAFMFASSLFEEISFPCRISFVKVSSYSGLNSSGSLKEVIGLEETIDGQHIVVVDDIIDTGLTMLEIKKKLEAMNPASVKIMSLISKPEVHKGKLVPDYVGFEIPNRFIVGFGLDYNGYGRNLKDIYVIN